MTEILYYPLIDCDAKGTEKAAMIPTPHEDTVRAQAGTWLEEMIPNYFRLCSQNSNLSADTFHIRCPRCGKALKRIGADINETRHGLYVCSACVTK